MAEHNRTGDPFTFCLERKAQDPELQARVASFYDPSRSTVPAPREPAPAREQDPRRELTELATARARERQIGFSAALREICAQDDHAGLVARAASHYARTGLC